MKRILALAAGRRLRRLVVVLALGATASAFPAASQAAGCGSQPGCPYLDAVVLGNDPQGHGIFRFPQAVAFSPGGAYVFVADQYSSLVQKFDRAGGWQWQIGGHADRGQLRRLGVIGGLATDRSGHLYVLDSQNDRVQVFRSDSGEWLGAWGSSGSAAGRFRLGANTGAGGIAVHQAAPGDPPIVYIADQVNHRVQKFTLSQLVSRDPQRAVLPPGSRSAAEPDYVPVPSPDVTWGSFGDCSPTGCSSPADRYLLHFPQGIAVNPHPTAGGEHHVYVADDDNHRVVEYGRDGAYVRQVGVFGTAAGQFRFPYDVGVDANNHLYVADNNNHRVQKFNALDLSFVGLWGGFGPQAGALEFPRALAALADDPQGGAYVADTANNRVQGFDENGQVTAAWGIAGRGPGYVTRPADVAVDGSGTVYVADTWAHRIQILSPRGEYLGQWGYISARSGYAAPATGNGQFQLPHGIAFDPATRTLWVADTANNRVQQLSAAGAWLVTYGGLATGTGAGRFDTPRGIAVDGAGNVYVVDTGNRRIQRRDATTGAWATVAVDRSLVRPAGVAPDGAGGVYVADEGALLRIANGKAEAIDVPGGEPPSASGVSVEGPHLYVSDTRTDRVLRLELGSGRWEVLGGEGLELGAFVEPAGVAADPAGRAVYVADQYNNRVQALVLAREPAPAPGAAVAGRPPAHDTKAPRLRVRVRRSQRALRTGVVEVTVECDERCRLVASGRLRVRTAARGAADAATRLRLQTSRRRLEAGVRTQLRLRLSKAVRRAARRAIGRSRRVGARVVVSATDEAGNRRSLARTVTIRR